VEAHTKELAAKTKEPGSGRLLESIEGLDKLAHMIRMIFVDEAGRLIAVYSFGKVTMQERVLDVELMDDPAPGSCEMKNCPDGCWLDHRREGLMKIYPWPLREPAYNPSGFTAFKAAIRL
jgi:hypothetical protein